MIKLIKKNFWYLLATTAIVFFIAGRISAAPSVEYSVSLEPVTDSTEDLGAAGNEWANLYVDNITTGACTGCGAGGGGDPGLVVSDLLQGQSYYQASSTATGVPFLLVDGLISQSSSTFSGITVYGSATNTIPQLTATDIASGSLTLTGTLEVETSGTSTFAGGVSVAGVNSSSGLNVTGEINTSGFLNFTQDDTGILLRNGGTNDLRIYNSSAHGSPFLYIERVINPDTSNVEIGVPYGLAIYSNSLQDASGTWSPWLTAGYDGTGTLDFYAVGQGASETRYVSFTADDSVRFVVDGTERVRITGAGLGVGTSTPGTGFAVQATSSLLGGPVYIYGPLTLPTLKATSTATSTFAGGVDVGSVGGLSSASGLTVTGGDILSSGKLTVTNSNATSSFAGPLRVISGGLDLAYIGECTGVLQTTADGIVKCGDSPSASAGGSDTQIQYNNGTALGGTAGLIWDDGNFRLGFATATPGLPFSIESSALISELVVPGQLKAGILTATSTTATSTINQLSASDLTAGSLTLTDTLEVETSGTSTFAGGITASNLNTTGLTVSGAAIFPDDAIDESDIFFSTVCASGNRLYINNHDLACEAGGSGDPGLIVSDALFGESYYQASSTATDVPFYIEDGLITTGSSTIQYASSTALTASEGFFAGSGSAGKPSITFSGDQDTGFYSSGSNAVSFAAQGNQRWIFNNTVLQSSGATAIWAGGGSESAPFYSFGGESTDVDTGIFGDGADTLGLTAGGVEMLTLVEGASDELVVNEDGDDIDLRVEVSGNANALFLEGSSGLFGIATDTPGTMLSINGVGEIDALTVAGSFKAEDITATSSITTNDLTVTGTCSGCGGAGDPGLIVSDALFGESYYIASSTATDVPLYIEDGLIVAASTTIDNTLFVRDDITVDGATGDPFIEADPVAFSNAAYSFVGDPDTGIIRSSSNELSIMTGSEFFSFNLSGLSNSITPGGIFIKAGSAGSESAPIYSFNGDTNTGIWGSGSDLLGLTAGGVEMLTLVESTQDELVVNEDGDDIDFRAEVSGNANALFLEGSSGLFGVGTGTPGTFLSINGVGEIDALTVASSLKAETITATSSITTQDLTVNGTCTGCGGAGDPGLIVSDALFGESYYIASSTATDVPFYIEDGLITTGSSTIQYASTTALTVSESISAGDGSATKPSLTFTSDPDTGLYADTVGLSITSDSTSVVNFQSSLAQFANSYDLIGGISTGSYYLDGDQGTQSAPTYTFQGDQNTGLFTEWVTGDVVGLTAGGVNFLEAIESTSDQLIVNNDSADIDFIVETDNKTNTLFIEGSTDRVGIATGTPGSLLSLQGAANVGSLVSEGILKAGPIIATSTVSISGQLNLLTTGSDIDFGSGDVTIDYSSNQLQFSNASNGYVFDANVRPNGDAGSQLGLISAGWDTVNIAGGSDIVWNDLGAAADVTLDHSTNLLTLEGGGFTFNEASGDFDFRAESNNDTHLMFLDGGNDRFGVSTDTPGTLLAVDGIGNFDNLTVEGILKFGLGIATTTIDVQGTGTSTFAGSLDIEGNVDIARSAWAGTALVSDADVNWEEGNYQEIVLTADTAITFSNVHAGAVLRLGIFQDSTGGRSVTSWPSNVYFTHATTTPPTLSTGSSEVDLCFFSAATTTQFIYGACNNNF